MSGEKTAQAGARAESFTGLRDRLFQDDLSALAPAAPEDDATSGIPVVGVAMEVGLANGSYLVYGLRDGSASIYFSTGGGTIGGGGRPTIRGAAKRFVRSAREIAPSLPSVREHPIPSVGRVRFSVFTSEGVRAAEASDADLKAGTGELRPLFMSAHELIACFRRLEEPSLLRSRTT
jgi:hypothetical protein